MSNFLIEYLNRRHYEAIEVPKEPGPVLTISREFGLQAKNIALLLVDRLNTYHQEIGARKSWQLISKDILELSAKELQTDSKRIEYIFKFEKRSAIDEFLLSLSQNQYQSNWKIKKAIRNVIQSLSYDGKVVILGRAAAQITQNIKQSLHVKLVAPKKYRTRLVMDTYQLPLKEAEKKVREMDHNRKRLIDMFTKEARCEVCYDVFYNMSKLQTKEVILNIIHLMKQKKLI